MTTSLSVTARVSGGSRAALRKADQIPAVVYGPKQVSVPLAVDRRTFHKTFKEVGESAIIELVGLAEPIEALVHGVDFHPSTGEILHVDFYAFERGKDMTTEVPIEFIGYAPIEKTGGMVNKVLHEVTVTCRPSNLPAEIEVNISVLTKSEQQILVSDLPVLDGVVYEHEADEVVAVAQGERAEEPEPETESFSPEAIEVEAKGKGDVEEEG